jgi:hypothetical protein
VRLADVKATKKTNIAAAIALQYDPDQLNYAVLRLSVARSMIALLWNPDIYTGRAMSLKIIGSFAAHAEMRDSASLDGIGACWIVA